MLQTLRDKTSGWIATLILGLLIIPFAFVGVNEYMGGGGDVPAARVKAPPSWWSSAPAFWPVSMLWQHADVTTKDFKDAFEQQRIQQRQQQGDGFDARQFESADNKRAVLEQLVNRKVLELAATRAGVTISDAAVRAAIASEPVFQVGGKFDGARYAQVLSSQVPPIKPSEFERQQRDGLQVSLIPTALDQSEFVTPKAMDQLFQLLGETRDISIAALDPPILEQKPLTDAEVKQWYDAHQADFRQPEQVKIEYVEIDGNALAAAQTPDEAALRKRYEDEKSRFMAPEQRLASHILITVPEGADAAAQKAAEDKAKALTEQANAPGADFAALAKANSQDPGSKDTGGDLGWVDRGMMVKPFEDALFSMQPGEIRGPVKTDFGYHVLKLREQRGGGQTKSFEQVREELVKEERAAAAERAYSDTAGKLVNEVLKNPTSLSDAAAAVNLKVQTLGPFSRGDAQGIAGVPAVQRAAFSEALIQDGTASDPIEIGPQHSVVIRVLQHTDEQARPLAQVKPQVEAAIRNDRAKKAAAEAAQKVLARVQKGESLQDVAKAENFQVNELPGLPRGAPVPSPAGNAAVFAAPAPKDGKPSAGKVALDDGRYAVFTVNKVTPGKTDEIPEAQRVQFGQQIARLQGNAVVEQYIKTMREGFKIEVHEDRL
ncbi:SurA N-terminal domain-containing protein [Pseudoxanthomonas composti]|uniref:Periplasmic chaperone PpiD n=1 Tax=Pseudoxanthomonas composti TaxID=2137479 RepID=A0A4Q1JVL9_9GAMM|nr:SurA N-terminal domain-containing protein [Pseudoxanthomonas composti]RXR05219.1 peptidylprolyl isomerase [Pseudoxanthomonas composti]